MRVLIYLIRYIFVCFRLYFRSKDLFFVYFFQFDKLPPGFTFVLCQKKVCEKMKQIGKSLIGYVNTMEAIDNKVEAVLKDCDGNQLSIDIPVATCQKPNINKAYIRRNDLILELNTTIQLHKEVKNAMVDPT